MGKKISVMTPKKTIKISPDPNRSRSKGRDDLLDDYSPICVAKIFPTNADRPPVTLESFRPKKNTCLDYELSETYLRWQVGNTKIRASHITGTYVPAPPGHFAPKKLKGLYFNGCPPVWKFLDEISKEKIEKQQTRNRAHFKEFLRRTHENQSAGFNHMHNLLTSMAGPPWFQELSPAQLRTIDNLQECILKDLKGNTIENVKGNMAEFGLYFRPNEKMLKIALEFCCAVDYEFLLILYQVMNPRRMCYSINDRLLLSAVVHLTIIETLRECHVRLPSPPRKPCTPVCMPCKGRKTKQGDCIYSVPPKIHYASPYLEPYTFKPDPPKFSGKYENKHIQYPQSPYFSYLDALRDEIKNAESVLDIDVNGINDPEEKELLREHQAAEKKYNDLQEHGTWKGLVPPTIKLECMDFVNRSRDCRPVKLPSLFPLEDTLPPCTCSEVEKPDGGECCTDFHTCECNKDRNTVCVCKENTNLFLKALCNRCLTILKRTTNNMVGGLAQYDGNMLPIIQGIFKDRECKCLARFKDQLSAIAAGNKLSCKPEKYTIGGVAITSQGPSFIINSLLNKKELEYKIEKEESKEDVCTCGEPQEKKADIDECCVNDSKESSQEKFEKNDEPEESKEEPEEIDKTMPWEIADCTCKKAFEDFTTKQCTCPQCLEDKRRKEAMFIVSGVSNTDQDGVVENVVNIGGVQQKQCDCLHQHMEKIKNMEEYRQRVKARLQMKYHDDKYCIGGVATTKYGPVYFNQGVQKEISCTCITDHLKEEEEAKRRMPEKPHTGRIKYAITGVTAKEDKNYFTISHAVHTKPCPCLTMYRTYKQEHMWCFDTFYEYINITQRELEEYELEKPYEYEDLDLDLDLQHEPTVEPALTHCPQEDERVDGSQPKQECPYSKTEEQNGALLCQEVCTLNSSNYKICSECGKCVALDYITNQCDCRKEDKCREQNNSPPSQEVCPFQPPNYKICSECKKCVASDSVIDNCNCRSSKETIQDECECRKEGKREQCDRSHSQKVCPFQPPNYKCSECGKCVTMDSTIDQCDCASSEETIRAKCECRKDLCRAPVEDPCVCKSDEIVKEKDICSCTEDPSHKCTCFDDPCNCTEDPSYKCTCFDDPCNCTEDANDACTCFDDERFKATETQCGDGFGDSDFKRFLILDKIPCNKRKQMEILKKLLEGLAMDGYPLAKLPDAHKLPIFRLWMQMRCGKSWTQRQKRAFNQLTNKYLMHTNICYQKIKVPKMPICPHMADKFNWNHFELLREMTSSLIFEYRRKIKQLRVHSAREYFPIMYDYPFPFRTFRNNYFAYLPAKEEDIYVGNFRRTDWTSPKQRDASCFRFDNKK
ncbi:uncharacterized protein [Diabrotica undecimpunctata]|uniref:uncharacterized protein n=1 Tax=Diabrotica undecimpunctata TaxID=50387 RepID=UPI003B6393E6